ncbi:hypothetical protein Cgig2_030113 [Carnegiea gigantea]|uniref:Aminotransferase-like plant mobile domain-containing protein n=1 Tax=Carnegiea gigantea TaxID=171969 RepID=A0A9Q1QDI3_9CARY|nr:hypothetical protein Cgig2_030113 [Carnegiea gigantea]
MGKCTGVRQRTGTHGLFEMVTFMDKTTNRRCYLHIQPIENDVHRKETKLPIRNSIMSSCKSDCVGDPPSLPWWLKENLKTGRKGKPTIEQWIAFWFHGHNKYHVFRKSNQDNRIPHPGILSSIIDAGARGWGDYPIIFNELGVAIGQCVGYCLRMTILASVYKGLSEISHSSHLDRGGDYFPAHFLYAWLAKNFDAYEDELPIGVCEPSTEKVTELPPEGVENIMDILDSEPNPTECMGEGDDVNFKEELAHVRLPQGSQCFPSIGRTPSFGVFDSLYATILQRGVDVTPLKSKVEGLIKQACGFKDLQGSYFGGTHAEEHDSYRMEVQGKLDEASHRLNTEGAHYEAKTAELKQVELRREE